MRAASLSFVLCLILAAGGCGDNGSAAEDSASAPPGTESTASVPEPAAGVRPRRGAKPISIRVGERVFRRAEPVLEPPPGRPSEDLVVENLIEGAGPRAREGDELTVEYVGIRYDGSFFTNSWQRRKPFAFELGGGEVFINPGWEKGLRGMRVGGRRELIVPPRFLYRGGAPPESKPADTLVYVVDLIGIE